MHDNKDFFENIKIPQRLEPEKIAEMIKFCKENNQFQNKNLAKKVDGIKDAQPQIEAKQKVVAEEIPQQEVVEDVKKEDLPQEIQEKEVEAVEETAENLEVPRKISSNKTLSKKGKITRIIAAAAACALIVAGVVSVFKDDEVAYFEGTEYAFETEISTPSDYTQIFNTIQRVNSIYSYTNKDDGVDMSPAPEGDGNDFSGTHQQTEGVDEADLMKTDGEYIYFVANGSLNIIKADSGELTHLSSTEKAEDFTALEMFLYENTAVVIKKPNYQSGYGIVAEDETSNSKEKIKDITIVEIYDVTDKENPSLKSSYTQKGIYNTSRMIEDKLYISTSYGIRDQITNADETYKYVPCYEINGKETLILAEDINIAKDCKTLNYTILGGLDINATSPLISTKAVLGYVGEAYASADNFYIAGANYDEKVSTTVLRFSIKDGVIEHNASAIVDGIVLNQFSMDEYNGFLRIATTANSNGKISNGIYVLDDTLKQVGKVDGVAKNEHIKSVRFDGDSGYIVTFLQVDPLFKIDLSDPKSPKVLSEIKIDGYSKYLQDFGEDKLLGIGVNADENGVETNLKLSMFTKDETQTEISAVTFGSEKASAYSGIDHKVYLVDADKNLIGVPSMYFDGVDYCNEYYLFAFENNEFKQIGVYTMHSYDNNDSFSRSMYIGDYIYLFNRNSVVSLDIKDLAKKSALVF